MLNRFFCASLRSAPSRGSTPVLCGFFRNLNSSAVPKDSIRSSYMRQTGNVKTITLVKGDGIGPELCTSVVGVFHAAKVPVQWEVVPAEEITTDLIASLSRNQVCLKGPLYTKTGSGAFSRNQELRKVLELYANVVPIKSLPGIKTRHKDIDMVIIRENTQGEYTGIEEVILPGVVQSIKVITRAASLSIAHYAFKYAQTKGRKKVTAIHKANIMKLSDGQFLEACQEVAKQYPEIKYQEMIIDNACMQLVLNPNQFDVLVLPNLYGTLVTNVAAGLVGGTGVIGGGNFGPSGQAIFEAGRHTGLDIAGLNLANPVGMLLTSTNLLRHMDLDTYAGKIEKAVHTALENPKALTPDLGGEGTTKTFTKAVIDNLRE